ncbi:MAG: bifunctional indole-3-glycerol phosphate synthase/phosphoribosylanthranilate isomerase [Spirochaetia bacterium]|nr:bifunctional indole-3-glycerol phosphate synthase/phosphoribosylanthranilate isomerase [Spirochaetia bacterium]
MERNIVEEIVERRKKDIAEKGFTFGYKIPETRTRPVVPFMKEKGVILEIKKASPSKGDIVPDLNVTETARKYRACGTRAISCLTEENYFKGSLQYLMDVCNAVDDVAVLRKDFLISEEEVEISYLCGADAVLLIAGILSPEKILSMAKKCKELGLSALVEVRTKEDAEKVLKVKQQYDDVIVCGVNSRNLKDFTIDLLVPASMKKILGGKVIFESGITTPDAAEKIGAMGFHGILLGEAAAKNPENAVKYIEAFESSEENLYGKTMVKMAEKIAGRKKPLVKICGLTRIEDVILAENLGADFAGFIFSKKYGRNVYGPKFNAMRQELKKLKILKVAVITDVTGQEAEEACFLVLKGELDFIQLHGISYDEVKAKNKKLLENIPHYFAVTEKNGSIQEQMKVLYEKGEARVLVDSKNKDALPANAKWIAGGINPENISSIIDRYNPELIDVSGGLEGSDIGIKDKAKIEKFFQVLNTQK